MNKKVKRIFGIIIIIITFLAYHSYFFKYLTEIKYEGNKDLQCLLLSFVAILIELLVGFIITLFFKLAIKNFYKKHMFIVYFIAFIIMSFISLFIITYYHFADTFILTLAIYDLLCDDEIKVKTSKYICSNCFKHISIDDIVCPNCGEILNDEEDNKLTEESPIDRKYNDLKKLKKLLDEEILTQEEFNIEKRKILNNENEIQFIKKSLVNKEVSSDLEKYSLDDLSGIILMHAISQQSHAYIIYQNFDIDKKEVECISIGYIIGITSLLLNIFKNDISLDIFIDDVIINAYKCLNDDLKKYISKLKECALKSKDFLIDEYKYSCTIDELIKILTRKYLEDLKINEDYNNYNELFDMAYGDLNHYYKQTKNILENMIIDE